MTKSDLKTGMRVETRNGKVYMVLRNCDVYHSHEDILFCNENDSIRGNFYKQDLTVLKIMDSGFDIVRVFQSDSDTHYCDDRTMDFNTPFHCIWTRDDEKDNLLKRLEELDFEAKELKSSAILMDFIKENTGFSKRLYEFQSDIKKLKDDIESAI